MLRELARCDHHEPFWGAFSKHVFVSWGPGSLPVVAHKVWTAEELEQLSPAERDEIFEASVVQDLGDVPPEFLSRVRARVEERIAATETPSQH
jgi:hypothetical protein